ncbi:HlyD family efflux transporter periplasmic adaptor subunit [soil metagenome]
MSETDTLRDQIDVEVLRFVPSPRHTRTLARIVLAFFVTLVIALVFAPWQQSAAGNGRVIAFSPIERQQTIEAPIEGRIVRFYVHEGSHVALGDPLVDISDNDPEILTRLRQERDAVSARIEAANARTSSIESRIDQLQSSRDSAITAATRRVQMAQQRITAAKRAVDAATAAHRTTELNEERIRTLQSQGLRSTRDLELADLDELKAQTELDRARASYESAEAERLALESDQLKVSTDGSAGIDDARATRSSAIAEAANGAAELARIEVRLARQETQSVKAPRAGVVLRLVAPAGAQMVKAGDPLAILIPDTETRAVELWIDGNDVPLIAEGELVRIQFEGWPAVQFTGWPSVAVGTFGGRVALVDATDDGKGRFRVLVVPEAGEAWPSGRYLRQGTQANGWVLLGRVSLGYELWRRFNGFPASMSAPPDTMEAKKDAKVK